MQYWMKTVLFTILTVFLIEGCSDKSAMVKTPNVEPMLPAVTAVRAISDLDAVGLEWQMEKMQQIKGYKIYRGESVDANASFDLIESVDNRYSTHYVDRNLKPGTRYSYRMRTFDAQGSVSRSSQTVAIYTAVMLPSVSYIKAIDKLPGQVKLIWRPHTDLRVVGYAIERTENPLDDSWSRIATVENRLWAEYIDTDLPDSVTYYYRIRAVLANDLLTEPSGYVKGTTKPLPLTITEITASIDLPKKIELAWQVPPIRDFAYFKIYRSSFAGAFYSYRAKTTEPKYTDTVEEDGKTYYYKIAAVDKDELEGELQDQPAIGASLDKPLAPAIQGAELVGSTATITWTAGDKRAVKYIVERSWWEGMHIERKRYLVTGKERFESSDIQPETVYSYRVYAVDANGIESEPSEKQDIYLEP